MFVFNLETEKVALMPPTSPTLSSNVIHTNQRQKSKPDNEKSLPSLHEQYHDHCSKISIIPQHQQIKIDHHYFSPSELRTPVNIQKKIHDIYVLPISPALSSSSSTTNTDETMKANSNTMPIRSRRNISSSRKIQNNHKFRGTKNDCFIESPQPKNRTLPRSHAGTLRRVPPPSQPPPLPPTISSFEHQFHSIEETQMKKPPPPPVPCRLQKPSRLPIGFEEVTIQPDQIGFKFAAESSSPQNEYSEHAWPNPPESMSTSQLSGPLSIPYDHLIPDIIMHQNNTTKYFHQYRTDSNR